MAICFHQAYIAKFTEHGKRISKQQYLDVALVHLQGVRHSADISPTKFELKSIEPWMAAFREVALKDNYEPLKDVSAWDLLLHSCIDGNFPRFNKAWRQLGASSPPDPVQPAACLAAQNSHHRILRHCLRAGAKLDDNLERSCRIGARTVDMMQVLHGADWRHIRTSTEAAKREIDSFGRNSLQGRWLRKYALPKDNGGEPGMSLKHIRADQKWDAGHIHHTFKDINW